MTGAQPANFGTEGQILYDANKKSKLVSYLLWFFLGGFGAHRFYNRRIKSAIAQLVAVVGGYAAFAKSMWPAMQIGAEHTKQVTELAQKAAAEGKELDPNSLPPPPPELVAAYEGMVQDPVFWIGCGLLLAFTIWWIVDAFLIPGWVRRHNAELAQSLAGR